MGVIWWSRVDYIAIKSEFHITACWSPCWFILVRSGYPDDSDYIFQIQCSLKRQTQIPLMLTKYKSNTDILYVEKVPTATNSEMRTWTECVVYDGEDRISTCWRNCWKMRWYFYCQEICTTITTALKCNSVMGNRLSNFQVSCWL